MVFWLSILTTFLLVQPIWGQEAGKNLPVRAGTDPFAWIYFYYYVLTGGVVILSVLLFFKNLSKRKKHRSVHQQGQPSFVATSELSKNGNGLKEMKLNGSNGHTVRRKRASNFGKFYTSMILELSFTDCAGKMIKNGNGDGHILKSHSKLNGAASDPAMKSANLGLIAVQTQLIEEQRRFMQQQSKHIEEKSQLIKEQSRLLKRQSDVMDGQFSFELR